MKLKIICAQCAIERRSSFNFQLVEIRDDGLYSTTCDCGHKTVTALHHQKFELLFDMGAIALIDGYAREAISSIAASLERFYEFYISTICLKHKIPSAQLETAWKHVDNQSERQFGAYIFLYLLDHNGGEVPIIDEKNLLLKNTRKHGNNFATQ